MTRETLTIAAVAFLCIAAASSPQLHGDSPGDENHSSLILMAPGASNLLLLISESCKRPLGKIAICRL
jgi:hypothetical protein